MLHQTHGRKIDVLVVHLIGILAVKIAQAFSQQTTVLLMSMTAFFTIMIMVMIFLMHILSNIIHLIQFDVLKFDKVQINLLVRIFGQFELVNCGLRYFCMKVDLLFGSYVLCRCVFGTNLKELWKECWLPYVKLFVHEAEEDGHDLEIFDVIVFGLVTDAVYKLGFDVGIFDYVFMAC